LDRGYNALIFPEGTRSMTGIMADFKPVIGYLALASRVGIVPVYLRGTYEAFPKGSTILKSRDVGAQVGRMLTIEELEEMTQGLPRAEAYRLIAERVRHDIVNLRDRTSEPFDVEAIRQQWREERRSGRSRIEADEEEFVTATG
jgi:long-chain acyl-CoA synthetase